MQGEYESHSHGFGPVYNENSRILILGSFPSAKSREMQFYYGHPQNRFWRVLAVLLNVPFPQTVEERKALALRSGIALWDAIESCEIIGASDSSIRNVVPTEIVSILPQTKICRIYANGAASCKAYRKYNEPLTGLPCVQLPSTSPANAAWSLERLCNEWKQILNDLEEIN